VSVTFAATGAPCESVRRPCSSPSMGLTCTAEERCGYCEDGQEWADEYAVPPVDMTNAMARVVFDLLAIEGESEHGLVGSIEHAALPFLLQRCMVVLGRRVCASPTSPKEAKPPAPCAWECVRTGFRLSPRGRACSWGPWRTSEWCAAYRKYGTCSPPAPNRAGGCRGLDRPRKKEA